MGVRTFSAQCPSRFTAMICVLLLLVCGGSTARADSDHIEESVDLISKGDLEGAEKEARLALRESSTRALAWATLGSIRVRQKKYAEGIELLRTAVRLAPRSVDARLILGEVYALTGKKLQAQEEFQEVLRIDPGNPRGRIALAQLETAGHNFHASLRLVEPILPELHRSADGILLLAKNYAGLKQTDPLRSLVPDWEQLPESSADSSLVFATLLVKSGLNQQAVEILELAKNNGQVSYELALELASLHFSTGDLSAAFSSYEAALSLYPECVDCLRQLAKIAERQKDPESALAYLIKAKRLRPENPDILFEFGKACLELDLVDDALPALQKAVQLRPNNDSYTYVLASAHVSKKEYTVAGKLFQALLRKHPNDSVVNYAMGSVLFLEVNLDGAAKYLQKSIQVKPDQNAAYYYLGLIAEGKGENDQAIATFQNLLRRYPDYGPAYEALGGILLKQQKYGEAQEALEKAIRMNPNSTKGHYQLGILLGRIGRQDDANREFEIIKQLNAEEGRRSGLKLRLLTPH